MIFFEKPKYDVLSISLINPYFNKELSRLQDSGWEIAGPISSVTDKFGQERMTVALRRRKNSMKPKIFISKLKTFLCGALIKQNL